MTKGEGIYEISRRNDEVLSFSLWTTNKLPQS